MIKLLKENRILTTEEFYKEFAEGKTEKEALEILGDMIADDLAEYIEDEDAENIEDIEETIHEKVSIEADDNYQLEEFRNYAVELGIDTDVTIKNGVPYLILKNVSDSQLKKIDRKIKFKDIMMKTTGTIDKALKSTTDIAEDLFKNVASPLINSSAKVGLNIFKSVANTTTKTGALLINSTVDTTKEIVKDIKSDRDILMAKENLKNTFGSIFKKNKKSSRFKF